MPTLQEVYDNPKTTSRNPTTLAKRAGTTVAGAKRFLNSLSSTQLGKRVIKQPAGLPPRAAHAGPTLPTQST